MIRHPSHSTDENIDIFARPGPKTPLAAHNKHHLQQLEPMTLLSSIQSPRKHSLIRARSSIKDVHFQRPRGAQTDKVFPLQTTSQSPPALPIKKHPANIPEIRPSNVVILGDQKCGKSTLVHTYLNQRFTKAPESILFETYEKEIHFNNDTSVKLQIWDFPGDDNFDRFRPLAYADAKGVLICFDLSNPESYHNVKERWIPEVETHCPSAHRILVGLGAECRLDKERGGRVPNVDFFQKTAERVQCKYFEPFLSSPRSYCKVFEEMALLISGVNENKLSKLDNETMSEAVPYLRAATMSKTRASTMLNGIGMLGICEERDESHGKAITKVSNRRTSFQKKSHKRCVIM